ncbi:MAG: sigma-70 family polymerase sigma factor [Frankiales bacterium]|nr:sigma-70 family polymerase sigma factor [Frankiales bacterium]
MRTAGSDHQLLIRLRARDEGAFTELVQRYHRPLVRLAGAFVSRDELAEDVAQETWLAMLKGLDKFEGRSSLRTWLFQICVNRARSIGERDHRTVPVEHIEPAVDAEQFSPTGAWTSPPTPWPERDLADDAAMLARIRQAISELPQLQRLVVTMRDIDGVTSSEVCQVLSISEANQRVLLHRGRANIRHGIDEAVIRR